MTKPTARFDIRANRRFDGDGDWGKDAGSFKGELIALALAWFFVVCRG